MSEMLIPWQAIAVLYAVIFLHFYVLSPIGLRMRDAIRGDSDG